MTPNNIHQIREQNLQECLISLTTGAAAAMALCLFLPGLDTKTDAMAFFAAAWAVLAFAVWTVIDIAERRKKGREINEAKKAQAMGTGIGGGLNHAENGSGSEGTGRYKICEFQMRPELKKEAGRSERSA